MIQILTFFLGLTVGIQPIEFQVAGAVTQVEIHLDGEPVTVLAGPPWSFDLDLGPELTPHRLTAVARDRQGREIDRAHRLINLDGAAYDPLPDSAGFGFSHGRELTAVAVELENRQRLPPPEEMAEWFLVRGTPALVVEVEEGSAEVVVVRDPATQPWMEKLASFFLTRATGMRSPPGISGADLGRDRETFLRLAKNSLRYSADSMVGLGAAWDSWKDFMRIDSEADLRFLSPLAAPASTVEGRKQIFNISVPFEASTQGVLFHAARVRPLEFELRISDTVALAGLELHASRKRRAVLTLLTDVPMGRSRYSPEEARQYLATLGIPLFVWSFEETMSEWNATPIHSSQRQQETLSAAESNAMLTRAHEAFSEMRRSLARQRIVWLAGAHLPQDIELSNRATGLILAGRPTPEDQERMKR